MGSGGYFIFLFPILFYAIIIALVWIFFRYFIRLVKSNEAISDSLEDIARILGKNGKPEGEEKQ